LNRFTKIFITIRSYSPTERFLIRESPVDLIRHKFRKA